MTALYIFSATHVNLKNHDSRFRNRPYGMRRNTQTNTIVMTIGTRGATLIPMKPINWSPDKNRKFIEKRGISFEDIIFSLQEGYLLDDETHPNNKKYPNQQIFVVAIDDYVYLVPYIENETEIFLKTIIPSRKATKQYLGEKP